MRTRGCVIANRNERFRGLGSLVNRNCRYLPGMLAFFIVAGCGSNSNQSPASAPAPTQKIDPATAGSIAGKVALDGAPPTPKPIDMSADPYCDKLSGAPKFYQEVVTGDGGSLANAVVYVKNFPADYIVTLPESGATLSQRGCMYDPHIVALRAGEKLEIANEDQTMHNILAMPQQNPKWNRAEMPGAAPIEETFAVPELEVPIRCNVHPWMKSYLFVFAHPYYAITGKDGRFEMKNVPPGTYTIEAWQEKYGKKDANITVGPKESKTVDFKFNALKGAEN